MNGNDLMDALSGLNPEYIDEAAFELHGKPVTGRRATITDFRKGLRIVLPIAAAVLLTVTVAMPAILRLSRGDSTSAPGPAADSAAPSQAEIAAGETPSYDAAESAAEAEPSYETAGADAAYEAAESAETFEPAAKAETSEGSRPTDAMNDEAPVQATWTIVRAVCSDGLMTLETAGQMPADSGELAYTILAAEADGTETILAQGKLEEILLTAEPFTLDVRTLHLPKGIYTLRIAEQSIEFTVSD